MLVSETKYDTIPKMGLRFFDKYAKRVIHYHAGPCRLVGGGGASAYNKLCTVSADIS
jgi:hypothetical protein